jgi:hypothetical protein
MSSALISIVGALSSPASLLWVAPSFNALAVPSLIPGSLGGVSSLSSGPAIGVGSSAADGYLIYYKILKLF